MEVSAVRGKPFVSVVIPVRNEGERLHTAVTSIVEGRSRVFPLQIVLVDDNSSDGACAWLPHQYTWARDGVQIDVIRLPRWSGIPYARHRGISAALASTLFITDANVIFPSGWDLPIREHIRPNRVLCATIADMNSFFVGYGGTLHIPSMRFDWLRTPTAHGGYVPISPCTGTILSTDLYCRAGGYDTSMPVYGAAEPEFSVRLWLLGAEIVSLPSLVLQHHFRTVAERRPFVEAIGHLKVHNYLKFGLLYLDRPRVLQLFEYYASTAPSLFQTALQRVCRGDIWHRRALLKRNLPNDFSCFIRRFGIRDAYGDLAG
jgi:glycosyltransferase involved in cell wall biosynthesis